MHEERKKRISDSIYALWIKLDISEVDRIFHRDCILHSCFGDQKGSEHIKEFIKFWTSKFYNIEVHNLGLYSDGDDVITHWKTQGKHIGKYSNDPEKKMVNFSGINRYRFKGDMIIEYWSYINFTC